MGGAGMFQLLNYSYHGKWYDNFRSAAVAPVCHSDADAGSIHF
jgi:hypothetical protein